LKKNSIAIWPALTWFFITTVLLCLPGSALPKENWFSKIWLDKWVHIGLFAIMVFLWCRVIINMEGKKIQFFLQIAFYFFLYGIIMEFVQKYFIPNRSFDAGDILADGIGSGIGLFFSTKLYKKNRPL
jgi:VanZ family protein